MEIQSVFHQFNSKRILIIGDAMIDAYMWGEINRTSPEAPVDIVNVKKYEKRLGGAANVALNVKSLGAIPTLCSIIGKGINGTIFKNLMKKEGLKTSALLSNKNAKTCEIQVQNCLQPHYALCITIKAQNNNDQ